MTNEEIVQEIKSGNTDLMAELWNQNHGLIYQTASRYKAYAELDDLLQESYFGLVSAVEHYNPEAGAFSSYLVMWVKATCYRYIENFSNNIRLPNAVRGEISKLNKARREFHTLYNIEPNLAQLAIYLDVSMEKVQALDLYAEILKIKSLDEDITNDNGSTSTIGDYVPDKTQDVESETIDRVAEEEIISAVWDCINKTCPPEQEEVIKSIYKDGISLMDLSKKTKVPYATLRDRKERGLRKVRRKIHAYPILKEYKEELLTSAYHNNAFRYTQESSTEHIAFKLATNQH